MLDRRMETAAVMNSRWSEGLTLKERVNMDFSRQYNSPHIQRGRSSDDHVNLPGLFLPNGNRMPSLVDLEQISGGGFSPPQMSSRCYDMGPCEVGPTSAGTFLSPTSGYSDWIRHGEQLVQNNQAFNHVGPPSSIRKITDINQDRALFCNWGPPDANALSSSTAFGKPILSQKLASQQLQSNGRRLNPTSPAHFGPYGGQMNMSVVGPNNTQQQGIRYVQTPKPSDSARPVHNNLLSHIKDKYKLLDHCKTREELLSYLHSMECRGVICKCENHRILLSHFDNCQSTRCNICGPIRESFYPGNESAMRLDYQKEYSPGSVGYKNHVDQESQPCKRLKMENAVQHDDWSLGAIVRQHINAIKTNEEQSVGGFTDSATLNEEILSPVGEVEESLICSNNFFDGKRTETGYDGTGKVKIDGESLNSDGVHVLSEELPVDEAKNDKRMSEAECNTGDTDFVLAESDRETSLDLKVSGVSLIDSFTTEQIKEHLHSLNQCTNLAARNALTGDKSMLTVDENTCQLCEMGGRTFAPPPLYCTSCGARVKHGSTYYRPPEDVINVNYCFCTACFKTSRGGNTSFKGFSFSKGKLEKRKNTDEFPEGWVQCDKCEAWQHQICALYNSKQDLEGKMKYICPFCRLSEIESKGYTFIPPAFGARDLPRTKLSDHIEQRLFKSLEKERKQRAELLGKSAEEVPGAEDLVVRVVLAVNKELKVKQQFLDILHDEIYPTEFQYKSKVLVLFQKVEGVDVFLFAMYLQEFGSECGHPNNRSVYISYLDSVKYFRPDIKTVDGGALRTLVYHEILIGYLDYCKQRGFTTCYIWACPPIKGEDYILYCHPETQKTPNPQKLLQWYKKLLRKAKEENVVVEYTNFYDHFFVPIREGDCKKITAARLPYFDGDYWSCAIEDMIQTIDKESEGQSARKSTTKRSLKAMGHTDLSADKTKDVLVMQKLGQTILPQKEDFLVVYLQYSCANCHEPILSGSRWSCNWCSKFHLCHRCLEHEENFNGVRTHTNIHGEKHELFEVSVNVDADTEDNDVILENDFLSDRHSFLKFCEENHHQFDTLRRAKHSSMMILHNLKITSASNIKQAVCSICHQDVMVEGLCDICSEFHAGESRTFLEALDE